MAVGRLHSCRNGVFLLTCRYLKSAWPYKKYLERGMLKELRIENLALIEELHVVFESRFVVLTGETGAGKSIILQAIALLSGKKASAAWIRNGKEQARVEAVFELLDRPELMAAIQDMGVDTSGELLVTRVLSRKAKSRFYVNGGLANAKIAEGISAYLLAVAGQHDNQLLLTPRHHLDFIDMIGGLAPNRMAFGEIYAGWQKLKKEYTALLDREKEKEQRRDFLEFQVREIRNAALEIDEDLELEAKKKLLKSVDELRKVGSKCYQLLNGKARDDLSVARKDLDGLALLDQKISEIAEKVAEQSFVVEDSINLLRSYLADLPNDQHELEQITSRIDEIQKLKRKYGLTIIEILAAADEMEGELTDLDSMDLLIKETKQNYLEISKKMETQAAELSDNRHKVSKNLVEAMSRELDSLCLADAEFSVRFNDLEGSERQPTKLGLDRPEFLFSANPGEPQKSLAKIASGGELSRLTLALRCILARKDMVETVIFDEVDAGLGGKAAESVAQKIKELSQHHQVFCITHLPQIASCAREHLRVEKNVVDGRTVTTICRLVDNERVAEIARMLDGASVSEKSVAFASELIARNFQLAE